jgi:hypothetical protein
MGIRRSLTASWALTSALAATLTVTTGTIANPAAAASTAEIEPRILAQEGLAIALAANVLISQTGILIVTVLHDVGCVVPTGGGSFKLTSFKKISSTETRSKVTVYFDNACKTPYIEAAATVTTAGNVYSVSETATYLGLHGQTLGSLSLSETATLGTSAIDVIGIGTFAPASGAPSVDLGLACALDSTGSNGKCQGGIAQDFPKLKLSLASVTPLTLTTNSTTHKVSFAGKKSDMATGAPGSLSIQEAGPTSLGIGGKPTTYGSAATKGSAAEFGMFPPTPTHWTITDTAHDAKFSFKVLSDTTRESEATVTTISTGANLATIHADQSGTGTIAYADGTKDAVTGWLLAD